MRKPVQIQERCQFQGMDVQCRNRGWYVDGDKRACGMGGHMFAVLGYQPTREQLNERRDRIKQGGRMSRLSRRERKAKQKERTSFPSQLVTKGTPGVREGRQTWQVANTPERERWPSRKR